MNQSMGRHPEKYAAHPGRPKGAKNKYTVYTRSTALRYCEERQYNALKELIELAQMPGQTLYTKQGEAVKVPAATIRERIQIAETVMRYTMVPLKAIELKDEERVATEIVALLEGTDDLDGSPPALEARSGSSRRLMEAI